MLDEEPIDEELEALLYAQVYYGKEEEIELPNLTETKLAECNTDETDQAEAVSKNTGVNKPNPLKKRYFEHNLVQEDKQKESGDTLAKESNIDPLLSHTTVELNIETSEKSLHDQTIPTEKNQELELDSTVNQQQQFIKISTTSSSTNPPTKDSTQIVTTAVLSTTNFEDRLRSSLADNPLSKKCKSDLNKLRKGHLSEQEFFNNLKRRLKIQKKQQNQIRKVYEKRRQSIAQSEVICLSDSDNSDIEVVEVVTHQQDSNEKSPIMKDKAEICLEESKNNAVEDDEIIYVAPPPVPIIHLDTESDSEASDKDRDTSKNIDADPLTTENKTASHSLPDSQPDIDDFLQPKNTPDNFNFSLHGSDFQNTEFVRPANPTDVYETESSTSTSDFNRDSTRQFCNSVKTIVFNEVEFPNQDIFDGNDLESFGEFITPKRGDKANTTDTIVSSVGKSGNSKGNKRVNHRTSSESSSESEYEGTSSHQKLPDLSPMVCVESSPKKKKANKKNTGETPKKKRGKLEDDVENNTRSKRKSKEKFSDKNSGILNVEELSSVEEPVRKSKRKSCPAALGEEDLSTKKPKKKKHKSGTEENEVSEGSTSASDRNVSCPSPKKMLKGCAAVASSTPKSKKKKKHTRIEGNLLSVDLVDEPEVLTVEEKEDATDDSAKKKGKKKKSKEPSVSKSLEDGKIIEDGKEILKEDGRTLAKEQGNVSEDSGKKKNKKRRQKESSESRIILSSTKNNDNDMPKRTDISEESSINKSSMEQEIPVEESHILEQNDTPESGSAKKNNRRKKRKSTDKISSVEEESNASNDKNKNIKDSKKDKDPDLEEGEIVEVDEGDKIAGESQNREEDIIIIEQAIPVHTIDSSESDQDILTFDDVETDLELANISATKANINEVLDNKNFDVKYLQSKMSDDPEKWKILSSDHYNLNIAKKGPRCNKCRYFGHYAINCPNKPSIPVCTLCGGNGHQEPRCPNKVCFTCGKHGNFSTVYCYMCAKQRKAKCSVCSIDGHKSEYCPDLWRRYFLTTTEGGLTVPKKRKLILKPRSQQWCSGCAANGHLEFECDSYEWIREYPASSPHIFKYADVYDSRRKKKAPPGTPQPDRRKTQVEKFVSAKLKRAEASVEPIASSLEVPDATLKADNSPGNVPATEEHRPDGEGPRESLGNGNEVQVQKERIEDQPPPSGTEYQHDPAKSAFSRPNPIQSGAYSLTNQMSYMNQLQSSIPSSSGRRGRFKNNRKAPRNAKINPVSVLRPAGYTPYHSVLNPCSLLGAPNARPPPQGLFNQVPGTVLAKQLVDLATVVSSYQNSSSFTQDGYDFSYQNGMNFYDGQQFGAQISPNPNYLFGSPPNTYQDFGQANIPPPYYDFQESQNTYGYRNFLDRPHTITRDPTEGRERLDFQPPHHVLEREVFIEDRERQVSLHTMEDGFRQRRSYERDGNRRGRDLRETLSRPADAGRRSMSFEAPVEQPMNDNVPERRLPIPSLLEIQTSNNSFISLDTMGQENVDVFNTTSNLVNVDESVTNKFNSSSLVELKELIENDLSKLSSLEKADAKIYKKKLSSIDSLKKIEFKTSAVKKQMYFLYKHINMFLFGVHRLCDGSRNLDYLRHFAYEYVGGVGDSRRRELLQAYGYIFGGEHPDFNYRRYLNTVTVMNKK